MIALSLLVVFFFVVCSVKRCHADSTEPGFTAGAASADITPDSAMLNWIDLQPYDGIPDPLHARAVVFDDGANRVAILTLDMLNVGEDLVAAVRDAVSAASGIEPGNVLVAASHSHSAPRSPEKRPLGDRQGRQLVALQRDPVYVAWTEKLPGVCAAVTQQAVASLVPATLAIGRANISDWVFNRRPVNPDGSVRTVFLPDDPYVLPDGLRFGPVDPTVTVLAIRDGAGRTIATLFHLACHAVSIYSACRAVSADWPGPTCAQVAAACGGEVLFLQGCAGNIVPARRGIAARDAMANYVAERVAAAAAGSHPLPALRLEMARTRIGLPLNAAARAYAGEAPATVEIQALRCGDLAIVTLPGEPLIELAAEIQARSPFPHTIVIGYANGSGISYVGMPGMLEQGGYEATATYGTDECGRILVESATRMLAYFGDR